MILHNFPPECAEVIVGWHLQIICQQIARLFHLLTYITNEVVKK